jgi:flagellar basal body P-ring formation protein FlgA
MRMPARFLLWCLLPLTTLMNHAAGAAEVQSLPDIQAAAEQYVRNSLPANGGTVYVKTDNLDSRLRLDSCPQPLEVFLPSGVGTGSRVTAGVRCSKGTQWTIYLALNIESEVSALVLNKALARGAAVTAQDVAPQMQRIQGVASNAIRSIDELARQRLKRDLPAGTVLSPAMLQPEMLIKRGQQVTVVAMVAGIEVRTTAIALTDGAASSRIRVKNLNSAKVVEGLVDTNSVVRVEL